jgi:hypothetical protein
MADPDLRARADARFAAALAQAGARDPREFYRAQIAELKSRNREAYQRAVTYFEERLIPAVAQDDGDPLAEWLEYGRVLAGLASPGRTVQIDAGGRAGDYARPVPPDTLVLHLPERTSEPAIVVGIPSSLSPAQRASYDLLVRQQQSL